MAEVATRRPMLPSSNAHQFGGSNGGSSETTVTLKRKTPSELSENMTMSIDGLKNHSVRQPRFSSVKDSHIQSSTSNEEARITQSYKTIRKCNEGTFRSVTELSSCGEKSSELSIDMDKAFKGLAARMPPGISASAESLEGNTNPTKFCSELHVPGLNIPLDFTLKTSMRVTSPSSSSVSWFRRLMSCGTISGVEQFNPQAVQSVSQKLTDFPEHSSTEPSFSAKTLYSWVHPQCSLPTSVITKLTSSMKQDEEMEFFSKRQMAWETAFRSLYIMLRKNMCNIFYVCSGQFVAMFTSGNGSMGSRGVCNAYLSQSTTTLRSLLKEQDICFTMPLCHSKVEQDTADDLFELSEIERYSVGVSKRTNSVSDVDNSPESLLAFSGNDNVHGLYDFLLNYRFLLTSLTGYDVPLLYSPVPFENATLSAPEVKCKVRRIDSLLVSQETCSTGDPNEGSDSTSCHSIEIKDAHLPPWTIKSVCDVLTANRSDFNASFVTEPMSVGLNIVLDTLRQKFDEQAIAYESSSEKHSLFGITNMVMSPHLSHAFVKCLKYSKGSFTASLSPV